jgi:predicted pyridoxine 5'-phosphate oxidase superfamily flavin-nucleotide-binding protein
MVSIPEDVKKMIREQQVIIVGTADHTGLTNISPRSTFHVRDDEIYWFELFKHKSYYNFKQNPWVSVAIFDTKKLSGYQMKGKVSVVDDKSESYRIRLRIIDRLTRLNKEKTLKLTSKHDYKIIKFTPKVIYTLNPFEFADVPVVLDADIEVAGLMGGVDIEGTFGINKKSVEQ